MVQLNFIHWHKINLPKIVVSNLVGALAYEQNKLHFIIKSSFLDLKNNLEAERSIRMSFQTNGIAVID